MLILFKCLKKEEEADGCFVFLSCLEITTFPAALRKRMYE
jgi:hypothetical protein